MTVEPGLEPRGVSARALASSALLAGACALGLGCDRGPASSAAPAPAWPAGTVLVMNDTPITAAEVDRFAEVYARLEPAFVEAQCRRLALTNVIFPLVAAQGIDPEARGKAKALADEYARAAAHGASLDGPLAGPTVLQRSGTWKQIGLEAWLAVVDLQDSSWSAVMETPGAFQIVRLDRRGKQAVPQDLVLDLSVVEFPYLQAEGVRARIDAALDQARLRFVDPAWRDFVPTAWQHRLRADQP